MKQALKIALFALLFGLKSNYYGHCDESCIIPMYSTCSGDYNGKAYVWLEEGCNNLDPTSSAFMSGLNYPKYAFSLTDSDGGWVSGSEFNATDQINLCWSCTDEIVYSSDDCTGNSTDYGAVNAYNETSVYSTTYAPDCGD